MALRFLTAGESHGPSLTAVIEGLPSNLELTENDVNRHLARRQEGYGRGGRMKIEKDRVSFLSGVRWGKTLGSPLTLAIKNRDWANWEKTMSSHPDDRQEGVEVTRPRPGHADLSGALKYRQSDVRNILERSSARETACRVAIGAVCQKFLAAFGIRVGGYVIAIGGETVGDAEPDLESRLARSEKSPCRTYDPDAEARMVAAIDKARESGDSLGGVVEITATGLPVGLGSHVHWDRKLDGRLAAAVMSIQAFKGVEIGLGFAAAGRPGSKVHDEISHGTKGFNRRSNNAGGLEGGMSNGQPLVVRGAMKPIPTLYQPLRSVDIRSKEAFEATVERSDVCAVPAAAVVAEAAVAIELADAVLDKFGGDSMEELIERVTAQRNYERSF